MKTRKTATCNECGAVYDYLEPSHLVDAQCIFICNACVKSKYGNFFDLSQEYVEVAEK